MRLDRGGFDAMPVSVISASTVSALCTRLATSFDSGRTSS
jgi:hypothetical protein